MITFRRLLLICITAMTLAMSPFPVLASQVRVDCQFSGASPLAWAIRIARNEMESEGNKPQILPGQRGRLGVGLGYTNSLWATTLFRLTQVTGDTVFQDYGLNILSPLIAADGRFLDLQGNPIPTPNGFNNMNAGRALLNISQFDDSPRYPIAAQALHDALLKLPQTRQGVFAYHPHNIIADGLYMTLPFYMQYAHRFNQPADYKAVIEQLRIAFSHLYDPHTRLIHHGWDESGQERWATMGQSRGYWGRAIGWYAMTLVDVLDELPFGYRSERAELIRQITLIAQGLLEYQDARSGLWYDVPDQAQKPGNFAETSASAMFVYFLSKSVSKAYLPPSFLAAAQHAFLGLIRHRLYVDPQNRPHLTYTSHVSSLGVVPEQPDPHVYRDGSWEYYMSEEISADNPHAIPAFVLAGIELDRALQFQYACLP